jgi:hypothetical protein
VAHRNDGDRAIGGMSVMPVDRFKATLRRRSGTGKIRASVTMLREWQAENDGAVQALTALMDRAQALKSDAGRTRQGQRRAKLYGDRVADKGIAHAARVLAPDLAALRALIDEASDFEDLSRKVLAHYRGKMDPARLAALVYRTRTMGNLGGRLSALKRAGRP